jgi:hypothetical protein
MVLLMPNLPAAAAAAAAEYCFRSWVLDGISTVQLP